MVCTRNIAGWIGPLVAACLILVPILRFCAQVETQASLRRVEPDRAADTANANGGLPGGLARWCELPGCKAGEGRTAVATEHDRFDDQSVHVPAVAVSPSPSHSESTSFATAAVAMRWHSESPALPTRLQI
jgi:hypothetical protein